MFRSICGGLVLAVCSLSVLSGAPRQQEDLSTLPMRFALHHEGPGDVCAGSCRLLISASGMITADTPRDFDNFVHNHNVRGATVVLDSKGGSVIGAIAFGRAIRGLGLSTTVGRVREQATHGVRRAWVWPRAECQSMCPFVLLGGVKRYIPPEARVLVHQIWLGDRRDDAAAASYSAEDLVLVQHDIGRLVQYTLDMGGGAELIEVALRIPPWEPMRLLSRDELRRTHLDTSQERLERAGQPAPAASSGASAPAAVVPVSDGARSEINPRGWVLAQRDGSATLVRRHPLTVEGDKIGAFEVALACGPTAGAYAVTYAETRLSPDDHDAAAIKHVDLWIEGRNEVLGVVSSRLQTAPRQLETVASGAITADLVRSFADAGSDSITLRTTSGSAPGTMIRVGNTGFAQVFPQLAASCASTQPRLAAQPRPEATPAHLETRAELTAPREQTVSGR